MKANRFAFQDFEIAVEDATEHGFRRVTTAQHGSWMWQIANHVFDCSCIAIVNARHELHDVATGGFDIASCLDEHADADCGWNLFAMCEVVCEIFTHFTGNDLDRAGVRMFHAEIARDGETPLCADGAGNVELAVA